MRSMNFRPVAVGLTRLLLLLPLLLLLLPFVLIKWLFQLALLMVRLFSGILGWWQAALLALFSYGLRPPPDRGQRELHGG